MCLPTFSVATTKEGDYDREGLIAGDVLLWLRGNFNDSFGSIGNGHHLFRVYFP